MGSSAPKQIGRSVPNCSSGRVVQRGWRSIGAYAARLMAGRPLNFRLALLGLIALALAAPGTLFSAHQHSHFDVRITASSKDNGTFHAAQHHRTPAETPDSCPICEGMALADAMVPATRFELHRPLDVAAWYSATPLWQRMPPQRSHSWNSRGPPTLA
ncbi:hypothetical protein AB5I39_04050 [Sphingomonas sp. MMS24-J45]|uniref:hypothetical protein n=1 Tax=Sphingomonas sp. MMS24-J45 TaxID=3238806 RepID=UPI00384F7864